VHNTPTYDITIDEKPRKIELTRTADKTYIAKIDDKTVKIETQSTTLTQAFLLQIDGKPYKIELPKLEQNTHFPIKVEETAFQAEIKTPTKATTTYQTFTAATTASPTRKQAPSKDSVQGAITAPMTGRVVSVKVKKGDQVKEEQVLIVIEAMKMENEITSTRAGTVQEINVTEGSPVSEGETLLIIT
jgi:biotin carboxyl carrier protein